MTKRGNTRAHQRPGHGHGQRRRQRRGERTTWLVLGGAFVVLVILLALWS